MTNRSTFPDSIDTFVELSEVLASDKTNIDRYKVLLMQEVRTDAEELELTSLKTTLSNKIVSSEYFNKLQDCITNLESFFLNETVPYLESLDVSVLKEELGTITNLTTAAKSNLVAAVNEVQFETDSAHGKIGLLSNLDTSNKANLVNSINEAYYNINTHKNNVSNPHNTSAAQVGAYSTSQADAKFVRWSGQRIEEIEVTFTPSGSSNSVSGTGVYSTAFASAPIIIPTYISSQSVSYSDRLLYPYIYGITTTGFSVIMKTDGSNLLGTGTLKFKFLAIGK